MGTGENEQGLRKIMDFTRLLSIIMLAIHFYLTCYQTFKEFGYVSELMNKILTPVSKMGVFERIQYAKTTVLGLLVVSLFGVKGRKDDEIDFKQLLCYGFVGLILYYGAAIAFESTTSYLKSSIAYIVSSSIGYILILSGGTRLSRILKVKLNNDIFNDENETFPQEERKLENEYSINLPAQYRFKGGVRKSWINIINPFRGTLILGTPGSGKSYFAIRHAITQHLDKGFSMFIYDYKYDELTKLAYNSLLANKEYNRPQRRFYVINFEDLSRTHRCNPLDPVGMFEISDAFESSRTIMLGLNKEWIKKQGDFFVESPINFVAAIIWYLRKYKNGIFCSLPHVIELMQIDYKCLFSLLVQEPEIEVLINPFISAWKNEAFDQLEGQIGSAKISMARLCSPALYYVLSGNDFTLDLNNPAEPIRHEFSIKNCSRRFEQSGMRVCKTISEGVK